ncbi:hypothetical protein HOY80DRAFT_1026559 [Tuber brumale]|nr:hypothetical protein HOY80DRAFT_1026559 [Tuber brumale]
MGGVAESTPLSHADKSELVSGRLLLPPHKPPPYDMSTLTQQTQNLFLTEPHDPEKYPPSAPAARNRSAPGASPPPITQPPHDITQRGRSSQEVILLEKTVLSPLPPPPAHRWPDLRTQTEQLSYQPANHPALPSFPPSLPPATTAQFGTAQQSRCKPARHTLLSNTHNSPGTSPVTYTTTTIQIHPPPHHIPSRQTLRYPPPKYHIPKHGQTRHPSPFPPSPENKYHTSSPLAHYFRTRHAIQRSSNK